MQSLDSMKSGVDLQPHITFHKNNLPIFKTTTNKKGKLKKYQFFLVSTFVVGGMVLIWQAISNTHSTSLPTADPSTNQEVIGPPSPTSAPFSKGVAGIETAQTTSSGSSFDVVRTADGGHRNLVITDVADCSVGTLFQIGSPTFNPLDNPVEEFNWVGALDVVPQYSNPFMVGVTDTSDFPWRTHPDQPDTLATEILFSYTGTLALAEVQFGWSPGKAGLKQKEIFVNNMQIGSTPTRQGEFASEWWEQMRRYNESFPLQIEAGEHQLTFRHLLLSETGDAALWDYIRLEIKDCL